MGLIRSAATAGGGARNLAARNLDVEREALGAGARERAAGLTPGEGRTVPELKQALTTQRDALAEKQYRPAYAKPIGVTPPLLAELKDVEGRQAISAAIKGARARKDYESVAALENLARVSEVKIDPSLSPAAQQQAIKKYISQFPVSGAAVDKVRIALNDLGDAAKNGQVKAGMFDRANKIGDLLDEVPGLKRARDTYHSMSSQIRALDMGEGVFTTPTSRFSNMLKAAGGKGKTPKPLTAEALKTARVGARQYIDDIMGKGSVESTALLKKIAHSDDVKANLRLLFGKEEADKYIRDADNRLLRMTRATDISPRTGSQTAPRSLDLDRFFGAFKSPLKKILGVAGEAMEMTPKEREALVKTALSGAQAGLPALRRGSPVARQILTAIAPQASQQSARVVSEGQ
jgi:hypothetical protein